MKNEQEHFEIPKQILVDPEDIPLLQDRRWHVSKTGYAVANNYLKWKYGNESKMLKMHRMIMKCPPGMEIDHINGNGLDNRKANLRICTHKQNMQNQKKRSTNTSGYTGVKLFKPKNGCKLKKPWISSITIDGRSKHLGYYETPQKAYSAYVLAATEHWGEFFGNRT